MRDPLGLDLPDDSSFLSSLVQDLGSPQSFAVALGAAGATSAFPSFSREELRIALGRDGIGADLALTTSDPAIVPNLDVLLAAVASSAPLPERAPALAEHVLRLGSGSHGADVSIAARTFVSADAMLGDRVRIEEGAVVGSAVSIGDDSRIGEGARIGDRVRIGADVVVEPGTRIPNDAIVLDGSRVGAEAQRDVAWPAEARGTSPLERLLGRAHPGSELALGAGLAALGVDHALRRRRERSEELEG